jgi:hypothetical protein
MIRIKIPSAYRNVADALIGNPRSVAIKIAKGFDFRSTELTLQPNYYDGYEQLSGAPVRIAAGQYLDARADTAFSSTMCVEMPAPRDFVSNVELRLARSAGGGGDHAVCLLHAGRANSIAPLHFDWDQRWILHVCMSGRKTFYLFPPDAGWLLNPVVNTSAICVPRLREDDRNELMRRLDGFQIHLTAGEALLFPSLWWHAVHYDAHSMSMSLRFGEDVALRPFAVLPRSFWLQRLLWELFRKPGSKHIAAILIQSLEQFFNSRKSWVERYKAVTSIYRKSLLAMSSSHGAEYLASEVFNPEFRLAKDELKHMYSFRLSEGGGQSREAIESVRRFLFNGKLETVPYELQRALAKYALVMRQGLEPRRGLVVIHRVDC